MISVKPMRGESEIPRAGPDPRSAESGAQTAGPEPYEPLLENIADLTAYAAHYAAAQTDLLRLKIRKAFLLVLAWVFGRIVLTVALAYAVWMVLRGVSGGLAEALGGRIWAGDLITGSMFLATVAGVVYFGSRRWAGISRQKVKDLYEQRRPSPHGAAAGKSSADAGV